MDKRKSLLIIAWWERWTIRSQLWDIILSTVELYGEKESRVSSQREAGVGWMIMFTTGVWKVLSGEGEWELSEGAGQMAT